MTTTKKRITLATAEAITGISKETIARWARSGGGFAEAISTGNKYSYIISPAKLADFMGMDVESLYASIADAKGGK